MLFINDNTSTAYSAWRNVKKEKNKKLSISQIKEYIITRNSTFHKLRT